MEYFELGSSPCSENCVQVDKDTDYLFAMKEEVKRFKNMLENRFPVPEDVKAWFVVKNNHHEFGDYLEVIIRFDENDDESTEFACFVEDNLPETWANTNVLKFEYSHLAE